MFWWNTAKGSLWPKDTDLNLLVTFIFDSTPNILTLVRFDQRRIFHIIKIRIDWNCFFSSLHPLSWKNNVFSKILGACHSFVFCVTPTTFNLVTIYFCDPFIFDQPGLIHWEIASLEEFVAGVYFCVISTTFILVNSSLWSSLFSAKTKLSKQSDGELHFSPTPFTLALLVIYFWDPILFNQNGLTNWKTASSEKFCWKQQLG